MPKETIDPREDEIRVAIAARPELTDRQLARLLDINRWSRITRQREAMAAAAAPPELAAPVAILADDVPAASDAPPPRQLVIRTNPTIICANCGREGTPAPAQPTWCKACAASVEAAAWRETQLWRCECGRPFARSTREPEHCIKCSGEYDVTTSWQRQGYRRPAAGRS